MVRFQRAALGALTATALLLTSCSSVTPSATTTPPGAANSAPGTTFTIGVSNGFVGSEYRTQMIADITEAAKQYQSAGELGKLVIENADTDVNGQIQQIRNLINARVNAIIVDPNSGSALDAVFKEAAAQGILVFAIDQAVDTKSVINVGIDQGEWAATSAKWLAKTLGTGKNVVAVNGISGHPANEARWSAAKKVFDESGIKVLTVADGGWNQATGQQEMATLLATYPNIDGVWTQDGMAQGVLQAIIAAGKQHLVTMSGEARVGFMRLWQKEGDSFKTIAVANPPGTGGTALHIAMAMLHGKKIKPASLTDGHNVVLPLVPAITTDNFADSWKEIKDKPDTYVLDSVWSKDEVSAIMSD